MTDIQNMAQLEMEAYDSLPKVLRDVFDDCPRKTSVLQVMNLPGVKKARKTMSDAELAEVLKGHLKGQAEQEAHVST